MMTAGIFLVLSLPSEGILDHEIFVSYGCFYFEKFIDELTDKLVVNFRIFRE